MKDFEDTSYEQSVLKDAIAVRDEFSFNQTFFYPAITIYGRHGREPKSLHEL